MNDLTFGDIHCHPTLYSFNRMRNSPAESDPKRFNPWTECRSDLNKMARGDRAGLYNQANFPRQLASGVKVAYASFTPIEKGFFIGSADGRDVPLNDALKRWVDGTTPRVALQKILRGDTHGAISELVSVLRNDGPLRQLVQKFVMDYPLQRVQFLCSSAYDYWTELQKEYQFLKAGERRKNRVYFDTPTGKQKGQGSYRIVRDLQDFEDSLQHDDEVALILTIEGGHVFSVRPDLEAHSLQTCLERIQALKAWDEPIIFLTLAHHFYNGLCGHAHSLPSMADWIMDQARALNEGLDPERGLPVIRALLDLDKDLLDRGQKRIGIDVRHMSAQSRKEYYDQVVRPYNEARQADGDPRQAYPKIPVIMSHCAFTGVDSLQDLIRDQARETDTWRKDGFYAWNINLCAEDVRLVFESEGLIGINFDRRICGILSSDKLPADRQAHAVIRQILAIVDVIMLDDRIPDDQKATIWDRVCLGTDYDGVIHPVASYPTVLNLPDFARDLRARLEREKHTRQIAEIGVDVLLNKILVQNSIDFARRHLPAACGAVQPAHTTSSPQPTPDLEGAS